MGIGFSVQISVDDGRISSSAVGVDFSFVDEAPSSHLLRVDGHLHGTLPECAHLLKAITDALQPGVEIGGGARAVDAQAAERWVVGP